MRTPSSTPKARTATPWRHSRSARTPGFSSLPTHRILQARPGLDPDAWARSWPDCFEVEPLPSDVTRESAERWLETKRLADRSALVVRLQDRPGAVGITARPDRMDALFAGTPFESNDLRRLGASILQASLLRGLDIDAREIAERDALRFTHDPNEAWDAGAAGNLAGILLPDLPVEEIVRLSIAGQRMPQKTTYFLPKLTSGWLLHVHRRVGENWRDAADSR